MIKTLLGGAAALATAANANAATYAIQAGHLIVDAAQAERGPSTVIVDNGRITRIDNGFSAPAGAIVVDERSRTVLPGMTDVHVHLTSNSGEPWYMRNPLTHGSGHYSKNERCSSDSNCNEFRWGWQAGRKAD